MIRWALWANRQVMAHQVPRAEVRSYRCGSDAGPFTVRKTELSLWKGVVSTGGFLPLQPDAKTCKDLHVQEN